MIDLQITLAFFLVVCLIFDLLLTAARSALSSATLPHLLAQRDSQEPGISATIQLLTSTTYPKAGLHLTQIILRFLLAGLVLWRLPGNVISDWPWSFGALALSALILAWLEWLVEGFVALRPEDWIVRLTTFIRSLSIVLTPILYLTLGLFPPRPKIEPGPGSVTEDELKILVDASQQEGVLEEEEREMIYSIFRLGDTLAREIMVPRIDITSIDVQSTIPEAIDSLLASGFSRVPIYEETVDNILGLLYTKDALRFLQEGNQTLSLRDLLRPPYFIPEAKKVDELLAEMQSQRIHMAMVVDEYGGIAGLVTLEDIVEEIVGEIQDEFDQAEESPYQQVGQGEFIFQGRVGLDDFNEVMGSHLPSEDADTLSGFIYDYFGRVPAAQETVQVDNLVLTVEQVTGRRIRKVRARLMPRVAGGLENPESEKLTKEEGDDHT